jgi:hypothetical protein
MRERQGMRERQRDEGKARVRRRERQRDEGNKMSIKIS